MPARLGGVPWTRPRNGTLRHTLPDGRTVGLFWDSDTQLKHIALFVPGEVGGPVKELPTIPLCGMWHLRFGLTAEVDHACPECLLQFKRMRKTPVAPAKV